MDSTNHSLPTLTSLREHVRQTLCLRDHLDLSQAELREARVVRGGETCGAFFQVRGPRLLRSYAVWTSEEKRILYYECKGGRFAETKLLAEPSPRELEAS